MGDNENSYIINDFIPMRIRQLMIADSEPKLCRSGDSVLHEFVANGEYSPEALQTLIDRVADLEIRNDSGKTPFLYAVIHCQKEMIEKFIENGANVSAKDSQSQNALHYIAFPEKNHVKRQFDFPGAKERLNATFPFLERLLKNGADVNLKNHKKDTPLMWASFGNHLKIVKMLLKYGADVHLKDSSSRTCLHLASTPTVRNIDVWDEPNADIISELIRHGAPVNCFGEDQKTPLGCILRNKHPYKTYFATKFLRIASLVNWERRIDFYVNRKRILGAVKGNLNYEKSLVEYVNDCYDEIGRMKSFQLSEAFNLCQFALRGVGAAEVSIASEISYEVMGILLRETFPIYHDFILFSFQLKHLEPTLRKLTISARSEGQNISLDPELNCMLASFLGISDLFNIFKASSHKTMAE